MLKLVASAVAAIAMRFAISVGVFVGGTPHCGFTLGSGDAAIAGITHALGRVIDRS
jgi:hypothetical protein